MANQDGGFSVTKIFSLDAEVDGLYVINRQPRVMLGVTLGEPLEPVAKADDLKPLIDALDGRGGNDAIDSRRRSATDQDAHLAAFGSV